MNNVQLIVAAIAFVSLLGTILAGAWLNQHGLERQIEAFRLEIKAELRGEIGALRAEVHALNDKVERIDRLFQELYKPILPGKED
jgi:hypothetical protein